MPPKALTDTTAIKELGAFVPGLVCSRRATSRGPLDGLRFAVKDLIDVAGCKTGGGNPAWLRDHPTAQRSAPAVTLLLAAGASLTGKTITDEFAFSLEGRNAHYGTPINPACPDRIPGGSSSGSAVAVAGELVDFALGTDTGGSVRVPASFVGVFGYRPTHGTIPLEGVVPFAPSYDTIGWFARDAGLLARVGDAVLPRHQTPPITRLLLAPDAFSLTEREVARLLLTAVRDWNIADEVAIFQSQDETWRECYRVLQGAEVWMNLGAWISNANPPLGETIAARFADAAAITLDQVEHYRPVRAKIANWVLDVIPPNTALVIPTAPCAALPRSAPGEIVSEFYRRALTLTCIAGHAGAPQVTLPLAYDQDCPIGVSLIAAPGCDLALLELASRLSETASGANAA